MGRVSLALLGGLVACATDAAAQATVPEIVAAAQGSQIVLLGEVHDNPSHHALQAEVMAGLGPTAVVFEMIAAEAAARVTPDVAGDAARLADLLDWANSGWPDFSFYAPLFAFGVEVPLYGALIDREAAGAAFAQGAAAVFAGDAAQFGLDTPLPAEEQAAREAEQLAAHCDALPPEILPGFVEAQRLRDAALAKAALTALAAHGGPVVVITGTGHARRDWGVPAVLAVAAPEVAVFSLGQFEAPPEGEVPFDLWALSDPVDRPDPCAAFR